MVRSTVTVPVFATPVTVDAGTTALHAEFDGYFNATDEQIWRANLNGDEVVHLLLDVMYADAPYTVLQRAVHIHPTVAEPIPTLLGALEPLE